MILISHRGNINGTNPKLENSPDYIEQAFSAGYKVEIDVWYDKCWWLGHDVPVYKIKKRFLIDNRYKLLIHAKNSAALERLIIEDSLHYFWHENDHFTLTSEGYALIHVDRPLIKGGICMLPELYTSAINISELKQCAGICSDQIFQYKLLC